MTRYTLINVIEEIKMYCVPTNFFCIDDKNNRKSTN